MALDFDGIQTIFERMNFSNRMNARLLAVTTLMAARPNDDYREIAKAVLALEDALGE